MNTATKATKFKTKGDQWCEVVVELRNQGKGLELSITGSEGVLVSPREARGQARQYWESFFEEDWNQIKDMNERCGSNCRTPAGAARFVVQSDGDYHGLDVHREDVDGKVAILETCGQIRDTLREWFPEVEPLLPYHLNNLHAECIHQEERGETYKTHPGAECPECEWKLGHAWNARALPSEVIEAVEQFKND